MINWTCQVIIGFTFPLLQAAIKENVFYIFATILVGSFIFTLLFVPETKGKSHSEIENDLSITAKKYPCCGEPQAEDGQLQYDPLIDSSSP